MNNDYGVTTVVAGLKDALSSYLQAQYHIRDDGLVKERRSLFDQNGVIAQRAYVEATPSYATGNRIEALNVPKPARELLMALAPLGVGVFPEPYQHQADALEAFLGAGKDVLAATGTGSGKTEIFLHNILGSLAVEASERPQSAKMNGCRALLLYPMNALVTDQLGRIRRLFGDERVALRLAAEFGRRIRFGMYTSRTPYPGEENSGKARKHIKPLMQDFYLKLDQQPELKRMLEEKGRWPKKDLHGFYNAGERLWERRLKTQPNDLELFTRHEMHRECPDILITNYSMLEYMMLRPIERSIFQKTKDWLHSDPRNYLTFVLDEAHMYRGTGGAEVAMLIRRLMARLEISRERLRCILTSASMGRDDQARVAALKFAAELTGLKPEMKPGFQLVTGTLAPLSKQSPATTAQAEALAGFNLGDFQRFGENQEAALSAVRSLAPKFGWEASSVSANQLADWLYEALPSLPPTNLLIAQATEGAKEFSALARTVCPTVSAALAERATEALLSLANFARSTVKDKVLLPARLHLFFRGLQGFYACINPKCTHRHDVARSSVLGRLWTEPRETCECGSRVYELLTHRDCGIEYLRGYIQPRGRPDYLFHEKESPVGISELENQMRLREIHLLVGGAPHPAAPMVQEVWIDIKSGQLSWAEPPDSDNYLPARAAVPAVDAPAPHSFDRCPVCLGRWQAGRTKIMDLKTKGEQPFAALVKSQTFLQPPNQSDKRRFPNQGRKVLLFSDGRQKAARLARNIPLEVEYDSFRESLVLAVDRIKRINKEPTLSDKRIYLGFLDVVSEFNLSYFDKSDHQTLLSHVEKYRDTHGSDLLDAHDGWNQIDPPPRFHQALLRQLCSPYYSIPFVMAGWIEPARNGLRMLNEGLTADAIPLAPAAAKDVAVAWMAELASDFAIGAYPDRTREIADGWPRDHWGVTAVFPENLRLLLASERFTPEQIEKINGHLLRVFTIVRGAGRHFLDQDKSVLRIDLDADWLECTRCHNFNPVAPFGHCPACNLKELRVVKPDADDYIASRKGLWRNAIKECLAGTRQPRCISAEEHTAQLSYRDAGTVLATTEMHELLFQDIIIDVKKESAVDVLSCTTTMEVGVDIGSLVAVGLRNVPPQRENYQQRAGRAGRRGSAVSTVVTYCHGGPHDSHYFHDVAKMVSGPPRTPVIKTNNEKIVRRHIHAYLIQTYFLGFPGNLTGFISSALGRTTDFFSPPAELPCFEHFSDWVKMEALKAPYPLVASIAAWLPEGVTDQPAKLITTVAKDFLAELKGAGDEFIENLRRRSDGDDRDDEDDEDEEDGEDKLLDFLFSRGLLPTYAFPTDLCSFNVEYLDNTLVRIREKPQQSVTKALSEYAPGRIVVIDKKNYRCTAVTANVSAFEPNRAAPLFEKKLKTYIFCANPLCSFVQEADPKRDAEANCPLCDSELTPGDILKPEVFLPDRGKEVDETDDDQEFSYASPAQFPIPLRQENEAWQPLGKNSTKAFAEDRHLVVVNKGDPDLLRGFQVCTQCGKSVIDQDAGGLAAHKRPYHVSYIPGRGGRPGPNCNGDSRQVLLGNDFRSDLMIMRIRAKSPFETTSDPGRAAFMAMQHAMRTLAEALNLAASRRLDLDPSEFNSGFRVYPTDPDNNEVVGEVYLFDTLSGGAGYASQIGNELLDVLESDVRNLLTNCRGNCPRSCYECLRHYGNQYFHSQLDRHLALALLNYSLHGILPALDDVTHQVDALASLGRMLQKSGVTVQRGAQIGGTVIPLVAERSGRRLFIGTSHGLYAKAASNLHPLATRFGNDPAARIEIVNEFLLTRNRPAAHQELLSKL